MVFLRKTRWSEDDSQKVSLQAGARHACLRLLLLRDLWWHLDFCDPLHFLRDVLRLVRFREAQKRGAHLSGNAVGGVCVCPLASRAKQSCGLGYLPADAAERAWLTSDLVACWHESHCGFCTAAAVKGVHVARDRSEPVLQTLEIIL